MAQFTLTNADYPPINRAFIVGLPVDGTGIGIETSDDLLAAFNSPLMLYAIPGATVFSTALPGANIPLKGGEAYIVIIGTSSNVVFDGDGWCNILTDPVNGVTAPCP